MGNIVFLFIISILCFKCFYDLEKLSKGLKLNPIMFIVDRSLKAVFLIIWFFTMIGSHIALYEYVISIGLNNIYGFTIFSSLFFVVGKAFNRMINNDTLRIITIFLSILFSTTAIMTLVYGCFGLAY